MLKAKSVLQKYKKCIGFKKDAIKEEVQMVYNIITILKSWVNNWSWDTTGPANCHGTPWLQHIPMMIPTYGPSFPGTKSLQY